MESRKQTDWELSQELLARLGQGMPEIYPQEVAQENFKLIPQGMGIMVAVPCNLGLMHSEFVQSYIPMLFAAHPAIKRMFWADSGPIDMMRNTIVRQALSTDGATHVLMIDSDMIVPQNLIPGLARHKQPVVSALCHKRWAPYEPTLYVGERFNLEIIKDPPAGLCEVTATGAAAILIDLNVFANIDYPWFKTSEDDMGRMVGEDIDFCYKCNEKDIPIYVDTTIKCGHIGKFTFNESFYGYSKLIAAIDPERRDEIINSQKFPDV